MISKVKFLNLAQLTVKLSNIHATLLGEKETSVSQEDQMNVLLLSSVFLSTQHASTQSFASLGIHEPPTVPLVLHRPPVSCPILKAE